MKSTPVMVGPHAIQIARTEWYDAEKKMAFVTYSLPDGTGIECTAGYENQAVDELIRIWHLRQSFKLN